MKLIVRTIKKVRNQSAIVYDLFYFTLNYKQ